MRVFAPLVALLTFLILLAWLLSPPPSRYIPTVGPRDLLLEKDYWHGRVVKVPLRDMVADGDTLVYKFLLDNPPVLVAEWSGKPPADRPSTLIGTFRSGTPCHLKDCRPAP